MIINNYAKWNKCKSSIFTEMQVRDFEHYLVVIMNPRFKARF